MAPEVLVQEGGCLEPLAAPPGEPQHRPLGLWSKALPPLQITTPLWRTALSLLLPLSRGRMLDHGPPRHHATRAAHHKRVCLTHQAMKLGHTQQYHCEWSGVYVAGPKYIKRRGGPNARGPHSSYPAFSLPTGICGLRASPYDQLAEEEKTWAWFADGSAPQQTLP